MQWTEYFFSDSLRILEIPSEKQYVLFNNLSGFLKKLYCIYFSGSVNGCLALFLECNGKSREAQTGAGWHWHQLKTKQSFSHFTTLGISLHCWTLLCRFNYNKQMNHIEPHFAYMDSSLISPFRSCQHPCEIWGWLQTCCTCSIHPLPKSQNCSS